MLLKTLRRNLGSLGRKMGKNGTLDVKLWHNMWLLGEALGRSSKNVGRGPRFPSANEIAGRQIGDFLNCEILRWGKVEMKKLS